MCNNHSLWNPGLCRDSRREAPVRQGLKVQYIYSVCIRYLVRLFLHEISTSGNFSYLNLAISQNRVVLQSEFSDEGFGGYLDELRFVERWLGWSLIRRALPAARRVTDPYSRSVHYIRRTGQTVASAVATR